MASAERKYRYAGISVTNQADGSKTLKFHTSKLQRQIAVWLEVPGSAFYEYVQLPKLSNKYEAACYLSKHPNFQSPAFMREFIHSVCSKYGPEGNEVWSMTDIKKDEQTIPKKRSGTGSKKPDETWVFRKRPKNGRRKKFEPPQEPI